VAYLPLAHVVERVFSLYLPLLTGGHIFTCPDPLRLFEYIRKVEPTLFFGVPRMWEKLRDAAWAEVRCALSPRDQAAFIEQISAGMAAPGAAVRDPVASVRATLGFGRCLSAVAGSAPTPEDVVRFAGAFGVPFFEGYGLSETSCVATVNPPGHERIGTVGRALPGVEVRIAGDGEVEIRGPIVGPGYWGRPEATAALLSGDGWLRTGDLGSLDQDGYLTLVGRKKEVIINAYGKNISPVPIESALKASPLVSQALVVGDGRPFLSAILVIDCEAVNRLLAGLELPLEAPGALVRHPALIEALQVAVDDVNTGFSHPEGVRRFVILAQQWTPATGELTPSFKLKRRVIEERYAEAIDALYVGVAR
jgi:long-chain acyl-CoA synthetase